MLPRVSREITKKIRKEVPRMALPSLEAQEAGAVLTGSAPGVDGSTDCQSTEIFDEPWAARHNREIWLTGPDGTYGWRNGPDGFFD